MRGRRYHGQSEDLKVQQTCAVLLPMLKSALNFVLFKLTKPELVTMCTLCHCSRPLVQVTCRLSSNVCNLLEFCDLEITCA